MIKSFLPFILTLEFCTIAFTYPSYSQQWDLKNPLPTNANLNDVYLMNHDTGYVCGAYQTILKTINGGLTWQRKSIAGDNQLNAIAFSSTDTGFAVGWKGIMQSVDGGETWDLLPHPFPASPTDLKDIFFLDQQHGWISGDYNTLLRTQDGGLTWEVLSHNTGIDQSFNIIKFLSYDTGFVGGSDISGQHRLLKKTVNGGVTWTNITIPTEINQVSGLEVLSASELWIAAGNQIGTVNGPATRIYHTVDAGSTWTSTDLVYWSATPNSIKFFDAQHGGVSCSYRMFNTDDGGLSWQEHILSYDMPPLVAMSWADTSKCISVGFYGYMFNSENGGQLWNEVSQGTRANFADIFFTNNQTGFAAGWDGFPPAIFKTSDGGNTWTNLPIDTTSMKHLNTIYFSDELNGWTAGYWGLMMHTTDAGQTWSMAGPANEFTYYALHLYTDKYIWAGGYANKMVRSTDYGNTWQDISLPYSDYDITEIYFSDSLNGFLMMGKNPYFGLMYRTSDGGMTWSPVDYVNTLNKMIYSLSFPDALHGFISIYNEGLAKTTDGGSTWQSLGKIGNKVPSFIKFFNPQQGIAVTGDRFTAFTNNGGETWDTLVSDISQADLIKSYFFTDANHGWLAGWHGLIKAFTSVGVGIQEALPCLEKGPVTYPNPVNNQINIIYDRNIRQVKIYNFQGQKIKTINGTGLSTIPVTELSPGLYVMSLSTSRNEFFVKFIKK